MKFDNLTPEQQELFMYSLFNDGDSVEYGLYWVWDWNTLELITEDSQGFITVHSYSSQDELREVLAKLDEEYSDWLNSAEY